MNTRVIFLAVVILSFLNGLALAQGSIASPTEKIVDVRYSACPVSGNPVKPDIGEVYEGKLYHFCSMACLEAFQENPKVVIARIKEAQEFALILKNYAGELPIYCKVTGKPAVKRIFLIIGDVITFYCCADCRESEVKSSLPRVPGIGGEDELRHDRH